MEIFTYNRRTGAIEKVDTKRRPVEHEELTLQEKIKHCCVELGLGKLGTKAMIDYFESQRKVFEQEYLCAWSKAFENNCAGFTFQGTKDKEVEKSLMEHFPPRVIYGVDFASESSRSGVLHHLAVKPEIKKVDMTVRELFGMQQRLDNVIMDNMTMKYSDMHMINQKIMATMVELGEMANEARGFKYWSKKMPNLETTKEEYIDVLHFVLSLGNDLFLNVDELLGAYGKKNAENHKRQATGY